jgi:S-adenosyl-L-methionine hydrolase (adenosine-forming)
VGSGVITLLTDFGTYVAELKGVLLSDAPSAVLVDVTHHIAPGDIRSAAYVLGRAWHQFPSGTVHLVVVDPGVGSARHTIALTSGGHSFVGPDNGVFTAVLRDAEVEIVVLPIPSHASPTFHGRDVFAPAAAALARGAPLYSLGSAFGGIPVRLPSRHPSLRDGSLIGEVVYVDRFGTLITNLSADQLPLQARVVVEDLDLGQLHGTYSDVASGALVAYVGSGGSVEIAVRDGSAAEHLSLGVGGRVWAWVNGEETA